MSGLRHRSCGQAKFFATKGLDVRIEEFFIFLVLLMSALDKPSSPEAFIFNYGHLDRLLCKFS